jgi:hypothetical protein
MWFFGPQKTDVLLWQGHKWLFFSTLNVMISQMLRNESMRFGRHIDIEVSYKILRLEVPNWFQFCTIRLAFNRGCLEAVLSKNTLRPLGVKICKCSVRNLIRIWNALSLSIPCNWQVSLAYSMLNYFFMNSNYWIWIIFMLLFGCIYTIYSTLNSTTMN